MSLKIMGAHERLQVSVKMVIFGGYGLGKTSLLKTLDVPTLCIDFESGLLAVQDWPGDAISVRTWTDARDMACLIGGPNPAIKADQPYGQKHFEYVLKQYGNTINVGQYLCIFIDSLTVASRLCLQWAKSQPEALSDRNGKPDLRAAYGLLASEMMAWLAQFQYIADKDIVFVGLLEQKQDELNRMSWQPQCEGSKIAAELPGLLDEVITMAALPQDNGPPIRAFVCHTLNPYSYPAKDRSGRLDMIEPPHLGKLLSKIKTDSKANVTNSSLVAIPPSIEKETF